MTKEKLPIYALTVRQPWAWAIIHAGKDFENRDWPKHPARRFSGRVCIHAGLSMLKEEYEAARAFIEWFGIEVPEASDLKFGTILGVADLGAYSTTVESKWRIENSPGFPIISASAVDFPFRVQGGQGIFKWQSTGLPIPPGPKWTQEGEDDGV